MSIKFSENAPKNGAQLVAEHLSTSNISSKNGLMEAARVSNIQVGHPIQVWSINTEELSKSIEESFVSGDWQYLIFQGNELLSSLYLKQNAPDEGVYATSYGNLLEGLTQGMKNAEVISAKTDSTLEPRLLIVPPVHFTGLWLHSTDGNKSNDVIIPIPPNSSQLTNFEPIKMNEFNQWVEKSLATVIDQQKQFPGDSAGSGGFTGSKASSVGIPSLLETKSIDSLIKPDRLKALATVQLPFIMQHQQQTNWCWSAVGTSVGLFYHTGKWTQCDTATGCLPGQNCCASPGPCNVYGYLNKSLTYTRSYNSSVGQTVSPNQIRAELSAGNPVCTRVAWYGGGAHFMAITGINSSNFITIQDPIFGTTVMNYLAYPASYQSGGTWTTTFYCKRN